MQAELVNEDLCGSPLKTARSRATRHLARQANKYRSAFTLVASRGAAILAQFAAQLAVGTMAGASGLGILQLFTSWTCIAGEVLARGLPTQAMRQVSVSFANERGDQIIATLRDSRDKILRFWLASCLLAALPTYFLLRSVEPSDWTQFGWLVIGVAAAAPLFSLLRLFSETLKAMGSPLAAVALESLTSPIALLLVCAVCWMAGKTVVALALVVTFTASLVITSVALRYMLRARLLSFSGVAPKYAQSADRPAAPRGELVYLWGAGVLSICFLQLPFLVMPLYVDTAQIGVFAIAHKLINIVTTLLLLMAAVFGPAFARCAAQGTPEDLLRLLGRTQLISTAVFLPISIALIVLAEPLAALFGEEFSDLKIYLAILAAGHLVNAITGLSGVLLNMAGAASRELSTLIMALIAALIGSALVGPRYGAIGLVVVFSGSIALKNLASYLLARQLLKSRSTLK